MSGVGACVCGHLVHLQAPQRYMSEADARLQGIVAHIEALRSTMAAAYEQFPKKHHYVLHAILVHSGSPDMGGALRSQLADCTRAH